MAGEISLHDLADAATVCIVFGGVIGIYVKSIRRQDALRHDHDQLETLVDDLRRGRGLILGGDSDWPDTVRRCFGFGHHAKS